MPSEAEAETVFASSEFPQLARLKLFARVLFAHWKERRRKRDGHHIIPQLDVCLCICARLDSHTSQYDESREDNPYVCFRRREAKTVRKTRRSETQNHDRLLRLRGDLNSARELLQSVLDREVAKCSLLREEGLAFEARVVLRELKRKAQENDGDDEILIPRERRKRRRVEEAPTHAIAPMSTYVFDLPHLLVTLDGRAAVKLGNTARLCVSLDEIQWRPMSVHWLQSTWSPSARSAITPLSSLPG
jgi:hypothetical protein